MYQQNDTLMRPQTKHQCAFCGHTTLQVLPAANDRQRSKSASANAAYFAEQKYKAAIGLQ
jgi:hypothetical protein